MKEAQSNINFVCAEHASKPMEKHEEPAFYVGKFVKIAFDLKHPDTDERLVEHMWVKVTGCAGHTLMGRLNNDPVGVGMVYGGYVTVDVSRIEAVDDPNASKLKTKPRKKGVAH